MLTLGVGIFWGCTAAESTSNESGGAAPTWHGNVAPIVARSCSACHVPAGVAPFALDTYASACPMATAMALAVQAGTMPPWAAAPTEQCTPTLPWKGDLRLSDEDKQVFIDWAEAGAPEGDAATASELPTAPSTTLEGANQSLRPSVAYEVTPGDDQFMCFTLDPGLTGTRWLTGVQTDPGVDAVVHHATLFGDAEGLSSALAGEDGVYTCAAGLGGAGAGIDGAPIVGVWAPGYGPQELPAGSGIELTAGSRIVMQVHYHPVGDAVVLDQTLVHLRWIDDEPELLARFALMGNAIDEASGLLAGPNDVDTVEFRIPANAGSHTEESLIPVTRADVDFGIFIAATHMHYVGTDMVIWLERASPERAQATTECLVQTPVWDFDWQRVYTYEADVADLPRLKTGDSLRMRCTYDNTAANADLQRARSDAGVTEIDDVYLGDGSLDEMCLGVFGLVD